MTKETLLQQLQNILNARLPFINRWNKVSVIDNGSTFTIEWSEPKNANIHPIETVEIPIKELEAVIQRKATRLQNETKTYK